MTPSRSRAFHGRGSGRSCPNRGDSTASARSTEPCSKTAGRGIWEMGIWNASSGEGLQRQPHHLRAAEAAMRRDVCLRRARERAAATPRPRAVQGARKRAAPSHGRLRPRRHGPLAGTWARFSGASPFAGVAALASTMPDSAVARSTAGCSRARAGMVSKSANDTQREARLSGHLCQALAASPV